MSEFKIYSDHSAPPIFPENNSRFLTKTINISTDDAVNLNCNAVSSPTEKAPIVTRWMKNGILIRSFQGLTLLFSVYWIWTLQGKLDYINTIEISYVLFVVWHHRFIKRCLYENENIERIVGKKNISAWLTVRVCDKGPKYDIFRLVWFTTYILKKPVTTNFTNSFIFPIALLRSMVLPLNVV